MCLRNDCLPPPPRPATNGPPGVDPQEHRPLREQGPWALKAGPRPPQSRAVVSGIQGAFPLDSSSANEEEEEPLCLVSGRKEEEGDAEGTVLFLNETEFNRWVSCMYILTTFT